MPPFSRKTFRSFFKKIFIACTLILVAFVLVEEFHHFEGTTDFVILSDKVGNPAVMVTFRIDPEVNDAKNPSRCVVGGDKLYISHNVSIFTESKIGSVLRRYHYGDYYQIFGKTILKSCNDLFMPVKFVASYPDMLKWPFRYDDIRMGDPDYDHIMRLRYSLQ